MIEKLIGSGEYWVGGSSDVVFSAYLGSCVGLAVIDEKARIGGLYHILLPRPAGPAPDNLFRYASTGLPLFFEKIFDSGAKRDNLQIMAAGGALVGSVTMQDLQLNIGGEITEIVMEYLGCANIEHVNSETGGYFSCCLKLDMQSLKISVKPLRLPENREAGEYKKLDKKGLEAAITHVRPIPQTALKILRMLHSGDSKVREVAKEVRQDQVISAKVLQFCNSSYLGLSVRVESIDRSIALLGEKKILQLILSVYTELFYEQSQGGYSLSRGGLFHHAVGTAITAQKIAEYCKAVQPDVAYTAGLLHDIGKTVLDQLVAEENSYFYRRLFEDDKSLIETERELFGISHTETGRMLAERWELPASLKEVVAYHHTPHKASNYPELTHLICLADLLMTRFRVEFELERMKKIDIKLTLMILGLRAKQLPELIDIVPWQSFGFNN